MECDQPQKWCKLILAMMRHGPVEFQFLEDNTIVQCVWRHDYEADGPAIGRGREPFEAMARTYECVRN